MIKINLALKKQASYAAGTSNTKTSLFGGASAGNGGSPASASTLSRILFPIAICGGLYFAYDYYIQNKLVAMQVEITNAEKDKVKVQNELNKIRGFEVQKAEIKKTEDALLAKVNTVEKLIRSKDRALKEMITIAQSLPKDAWISEMVAVDNRISIKGNAVDMGLISDVMTKLESSIYFKEVSLTKSTSEGAGTQAVFELTARRE